MIELVRDGYKTSSVVYDVIIPHKRWPKSPFTTRQGRELVVYSLIVPRLE
jgi:hypothetical protein